MVEMDEYGRYIITNDTFFPNNCVCDDKVGDSNAEAIKIALNSLIEIIQIAIDCPDPEKQNNLLEFVDNLARPIYYFSDSRFEKEED